VLEEFLPLVSRAADGPPTHRDREVLLAAVHEARALVGADVIILCTPGLSEASFEVRVPPDASWPPSSLIKTWLAESTRCVQPTTIDQGALPPGLRTGSVLPVLTSEGRGIVAAFSASAASLSPEQCAGLALVIQKALVRAEILQVQQDVEVATTRKVRAHIALEIHDGPLQRLSGIMLHLRHLRSAGKAPDESLLWVEAELEQAVRQTRLLIRIMLRASAVEASVEERIRAALARLGHAQALTWSLQWDVPEDALPAPAANEVFLVINEAIANVYRHAAAKRVEAVGRVEDDVLEVIIRDDGIGFDVAKALRRDIRRLSFGLLSMQERMSALGGTLTFRSQAGRGTRAFIRLPLGPLRADQSA
jgi:signal transduction histidine kinase